MGLNKNFLKILVFVVVCTYFAYALYWFVKTIPWIVDISLRPEVYVPATGFRFVDAHSVAAAYLMEYSGFFGLFVRVIAASYALLVAVLVLRTEAVSFQVVRDKVSKALLLEGLHFLLLIPAIYFLGGFSALPSVSNYLLLGAILTQILLITPFLISLSLKVKKREVGVHSPELHRLAGLAAMSYVIALWVIYMLKWTEMTAVDSHLFSALPIRILGLLNTVIVQSLAVVFAVVAFYVLRKSGSVSTLRWWGLSSIFLSAHAIIYVIYVTSVGIPRFIPFGELWLIPLLSLGIYLLLKNPLR